MFLNIAIWYLNGCKSGGGSSATIADSAPVCAPQMNVGDFNDPVTATDYNGLGLFIVAENNFVWLKDYVTDHYYKVDSTNNEIGGSEGLIFNDASCTQLIGEVFNYPLRQMNDVYVFQFEGSIYEYPIAPGSFFGTLNQDYYFKTEYGSCTPCAGPVDNVREVTQSAFAM